MKTIFPSRYQQKNAETAEIPSQSRFSAASAASCSTLSPVAADACRVVAKRSLISPLKPVPSSMFFVECWLPARATAEFDVPRPAILHLPSAILHLPSAILLLLLSLPAVSLAEDFTYATNAGTISITGYTGTNSAVTIPATINGLPVTSIGTYAFRVCTSLTSITVDTANPNYSSVDGVLFNKSQTALIQCPGGRAGSYTIPTSVTYIGDGAFGYCTSLTSVTIGNSVIFIRSYAFESCASLTGVYFRGNATSLGVDVFSGADQATVYYLPGTLGWGDTFGGRPTALWLPQVQTSDGSFGVRTNQFGFNIAWADGQTLVVEACTNLANPVWSPLRTNTLTSDTLYFSDPQWTNHPARFYRVGLPE